MEVPFHNNIIGNFMVNVAVGRWRNMQINGHLDGDLDARWCP